MSDAVSFMDLIEAGDLDGIRALAEQHSTAVHRHMAYERPWGEELWLPLHHAVRLGKADVVEVLIEVGSNVNGRTRFAAGPTKARATALHVAVTENQLAIAEMLLKAGAEVRAQKADGATPREMVEAMIKAGHEEYEPFLKLIEQYEKV
ncbi:ankyrin repeat domain-containing protein [Poriferisphaera corsica]|nr:ankyrin repeat domain-containing protein [Poriferisphaera corsica]